MGGECNLVPRAFSFEIKRVEVEKNTQNLHILASAPSLVLRARDLFGYAKKSRPSRPLVEIGRQVSIFGNYY